jgi:hypothetical protein
VSYLNTVPRVVAALAALALAMPLLVCALPLFLESRARSRRRRRRGYIRLSPNAYDSVSRATAPRAGTSTGCSTRPGGLSAVRDRPSLRVALSRIFVPTAYTNATASRRGDPTTAASGTAGINGARALAERVGMPEYGGDAA